MLPPKSGVTLITQFEHSRCKLKFPLLIHCLASHFCLNLPSIWIPLLTIKTSSSKHPKLSKTLAKNADFPPLLRSGKLTPQLSQTILKTVWTPPTITVSVHLGSVEINPFSFSTFTAVHICFTFSNSKQPKTKVKISLHKTNTWQLKKGNNKHTYNLSLTLSLKSHSVKSQNVDNHLHSPTLYK